MLDDNYDIPLCLSTVDPQLHQQVCNEHTVMAPEQIFSLPLPEDNVHQLPQVAETRLCRVNLKFGDERVYGILDTGAQRSLLNASSIRTK